MIRAIVARHGVDHGPSRDAGLVTCLAQFGYRRDTPRIASCFRSGRRDRRRDALRVHATNDLVPTRRNFRGNIRDRSAERRSPSAPRRRRAGFRNETADPRNAKQPPRKPRHTLSAVLFRRRAHTGDEPGTVNGSARDASRRKVLAKLDAPHHAQIPTAPPSAVVGARQRVTAPSPQFVRTTLRASAQSWRRDLCAIHVLPFCFGSRPQTASVSRPSPSRFHRARPPRSRTCTSSPAQPSPARRRSNPLKEEDLERERRLVRRGDRRSRSRHGRSRVRGAPPRATRAPLSSGSQAWS